MRMKGLRIRRRALAGVLAASLAALHIGTAALAVYADDRTVTRMGTGTDKGYDMELTVSRASEGTDWIEYRYSQGAWIFCSLVEPETFLEALIRKNRHGIEELSVEDVSEWESGDEDVLQLLDGGDALILGPGTVTVTGVYRGVDEEEFDWDEEQILMDPQITESSEDGALEEEEAFPAVASAANATEKAGTEETGDYLTSAIMWEQEEEEEKETEQEKVLTWRIRIRETESLDTCGEPEVRDWSPDPERYSIENRPHLQMNKESGRKEAAGETYVFCTPDADDPQAFRYYQRGRYLGYATPELYNLIDVSDSERKVLHLYCSDRLHPAGQGIWYRRISVQDAYEILGLDEAEESGAVDRLYSIVFNSYPYISYDEMVQRMAGDGLIGDDLDQINPGTLDLNQVILAVQEAIWNTVNYEDPKTSAIIDRPEPLWRTRSNTQAPLTDAACTAQWIGMEASLASGMREYLGIPEARHRIVQKNFDLIYEWLTEQAEPFAAGPVNPEVTVQALRYDEAGGRMKLLLDLGMEVSGRDELSVTVFEGQEQEVYRGPASSRYLTVELDAKAGTTYTTVVSGTRILPRDVYFYTSTSRAISQCFIGAGEGPTPVFGSVVFTSDGVDQGENFEFWDEAPTEPEEPEEPEEPKEPEEPSEKEESSEAGEQTEETEASSEAGEQTEETEASSEAEEQIEETEESLEAEERTEASEEAETEAESAADTGAETTEVEAETEAEVEAAETGTAAVTEAEAETEAAETGATEEAAAPAGERAPGRPGALEVVSVPQNRETRTGGDLPVLEIAEEPVPLGAAPDTLFMIADEEVPMTAFAPKTGDSRPILELSVIAMLALGLMGFFGFRAGKKE